MPGFRQAFSSVLGDLAKAPFIRSLRGMDDAAPIGLFNREQHKKFRAYIANDARARSQWFNEVGSNYFAGRGMRSIDKTGRPVWGEANRSHAMHRKGVAWGLAGLAAANVVGADPLGLRTAGNEAIRLGFHGTVGVTAYRMGGAAKLAGLAYMGLGGLNLMRRGDQIGPF